MTRQRELRIGAAHARAVVADSNQALPTILDVDADRAGAGIECVLDQLLHHRRGPLDHLAGGDLICDLGGQDRDRRRHGRDTSAASTQPRTRSEEHTSELQSRLHLVCRLLLEKKKQYNISSARQYSEDTLFES